MPLQSCGWDANIAEKQVTHAFKVKCMNCSLVQIQSGQKSPCASDDYSTKNTQKYFEQFQSFTTIK
jgi:hypothetical protein